MKASKSRKKPISRSKKEPREDGGSGALSSPTSVGSGAGGMGGSVSPHAEQDATCTGLILPQEGHVRRITAEHEGQRSASSATGASQKTQFMGRSSTVTNQRSTDF